VVRLIDIAHRDYRAQELLHTVHGVEDIADPTPVPGLSPVQQRTLDVLRLSGEPIVFDVGFVAEIRTEMRVALDHFATRLQPDAEVWISKHSISSVLDCEEHHLQPSPFEWSAANARGTVAHRAIELLLSWRGEPTPIDLVDEALARLADENKGISQWLNALTPGDEADVRGQTTVRVTQFVENFPPLSKRWAPVTEASVRWPSSGPITLSGKVDLLFGRPQGRESRKVIIDLKTGRPHVRHRQDLGFYALLETLVREVPPRKVATFYLDAAEAHADDVTERMLVTAMRRTLDGISAIIELETEGRTPIRRPGSGCRWCPVAAECEEGQAYLSGQLDPG
jgi:PD-(D/E)XK nuclease superfamily